jgi:hypothetical protein
MAPQVPDGTQPESRVKRFARGVGNATSTAEGYFVPYAEVLLRHLALQTLVLIMDGRVGGRGGVALLSHVVSKGRALPLAWQVRAGQKGHCPEALHLAVVAQVHALLPVGAHVVVLGDGACAGARLQHTGQASRWAYVVRTGSHIPVGWNGTRFRCDTVGACSKPGTLVARREVRVTQAAYGPLLLRCCWAKG